MLVEEAAKLKLGEVIYECEVGQTIATRVIQEPEIQDDQVKWVGKDLKTGRLINYLLTKGAEHYIKLYKEPQYIIRKDDGKHYLDDGLEGIELKI